ncbi:HupE/UreJ family protein [Alteromonas ponticola]|uniref:HupE/UreJ family protein n=1 Tax=Alteromonas aquimaris TaxID=2998417 RepID=A0ABT3P4N7_9ALTE|nr:HupE/UreJ family protein [Alteromonas aquimaris]MCW8107460.1 HupE/UreJ family protein [Alteromonas aquimaris]
MKSVLHFTIAFITSFFLLPAVHAHEISSAYLTLEKDSNSELSGLLFLRPFDLEQSLLIDSDKNGELTWAEVKQHEREIANMVKATLTVFDRQNVCPFSTSSLATATVGGQLLIAIPLTFRCDSSKQIGVNYQGFFNIDKSHKLLISVNYGDKTLSNVITTTKRQITFTDQSHSQWSTFITFVKEGVIHIWIGVDHILFLLATLLTVNLARSNRRWVPINKVKDIFKQTLYIVTAFTLAHSMTLTATALGWIQTNSRYVEFGIALSVLLTALNNIWPIVYRIGWITFAFGLLHGMGFASVFADLNANQNNLVLTVGAFNLGVEIGQLAIVAIIFPLLIWARKGNIYPKYIMPATSSVVALTALTWAIQRW